jgi:hypothetical protein
MNTEHEDIESKMRTAENEDTSFQSEHKEKEVWFKSIEAIIKEAKSEPSSEELIKLRFVKYLHDPKRPHCFELTPLAEVSPSTQFITVSYCWDQPKHEDELPEYRILKDGSEVKLRCPDLVFHRSIRFARHKKCDLIWIDQECVKQKGDTDYKEDLKNHLNIMDRVYSQSVYTVAPLATNDFLEEHQVDSLLSPRSMNFGKFRMNDWFRRAWTLNERYCAREVCVLLKTHGQPSGSAAQLNFEKLEDDLVLTLPNKTLSDDAPIDRMDILFGHKAIRDQAYNVIMHSMKDDNKVLYKLGQQMAMSGCKLLSDKIAIYGNMFKLPKRFDSGKLNESRFYFPTCVLALLLYNRFPDSEVRHKLYMDNHVLDGWFNMSHGAEIRFLRYWSDLRIEDEAH